MMQYRIYNILKIYRELMIIYMCGSQTELRLGYSMQLVNIYLSIYICVSLQKLIDWFNRLQLQTYVCQSINHNTVMITNILLLM